MVFIMQACLPISCQIDERIKLKISVIVPLIVHLAIIFSNNVCLSVNHYWLSVSYFCYVSLSGYLFLDGLKVKFAWNLPKTPGCAPRYQF